jgi:hypothetical protein
VWVSAPCFPNAGRERWVLGISDGGIVLDTGPASRRTGGMSERWREASAKEDREYLGSTGLSWVFLFAAGTQTVGLKRGRSMAQWLGRIGRLVQSKRKFPVVERWRWFRWFGGGCSGHGRWQEFWNLGWVEGCLVLQTWASSRQLRESIYLSPLVVERAVARLLASSPPRLLASLPPEVLTCVAWVCQLRGCVVRGAWLT